MFERDGRVGGADVAQLLFQCHARMNRPVSHAASPPMQVHETMHLACAVGASLDALPAVFELMPAITYASANGEEKMIQKAPCTH